VLSAAALGKKKIERNLPLKSQKQGKVCFREKKEEEEMGGKTIQDFQSLV
jgi:hypothetical protein